MLSDANLHTKTEVCNKTEIEKKYTERNWFVVKTRPRHEKKVNSLLQEYGYHTYLPLVKTIRIWSDRKKKVTVPLIPSTLFIRDIDCDKKTLYSVPGFHSILKLNSKIGVVRPEEIEQLKIVTGEEELEFDSVNTESFNRGDEVEITGGPLRGFFAKAIEEMNTFRVLISIPALGIGYSVNVAKNNIRKVEI